MLCGMKTGWLRRAFLFGFVVVGSTAVAQLPAVVKPGDQVPQGAEILLWEQGAPGAVGTTVEDKPRLEYFGASPDAKLKDGLRTAVIVCPSGGYRTLHIFEQGPHGTALAEQNPVLSIWTTSLVNWMRMHDWLPPLVPPLR